MEGKIFCVIGLDFEHRQRAIEKIKEGIREIYRRLARKLGANCEMQ